MSTGPGQPAPIFLQRRTYRQRRMRDALRLLPAAGLFLWALPLIWSAEDGAAPATSASLAYIFGVWAVLIVIGRMLARRIGPEDDWTTPGTGTAE